MLQRANDDDDEVVLHEIEDKYKNSFQLYQNSFQYALIVVFNSLTDLDVPCDSSEQ